MQGSPVAYVSARRSERCPWVSPYLVLASCTASASLRRRLRRFVRLAELMEELRVLADRDVLTGLPNTRAFEVAVSARLDLGQPFVLFVGDLDGLKRVNQASGYDEGNDLLQRVAERLTRLLPSACDVARIGGDEFALLLACERPDDASRLASRLERDLDAEGARITFGWSTFPQDGSTALALYRVADERLYARKILRGERRGVFGAVPDLSATGG